MALGGSTQERGKVEFIAREANKSTPLFPSLKIWEIWNLIFLIFAKQLSQMVLICQGTTKGFLTDNKTKEESVSSQTLFQPKLEAKSITLIMLGVSVSG